MHFLVPMTFLVGKASLFTFLPVWRASTLLLLNLRPWRLFIFQRNSMTCGRLEIFFFFLICFITSVNKLLLPSRIPPLFLSPSANNITVSHQRNVMLTTCRLQSLWPKCNCNQLVSCQPAARSCFFFFSRRHSWRVFQQVWELGPGTRTAEGQHSDLDIHSPLWGWGRGGATTRRHSCTSITCAVNILWTISTINI